MRPIALVVALFACGGQGSGPYVIGDCSMRCERTKQQLMHDFGATNVSCWDSEIYSASSAQRCDCLFSQRWGVISSGSTACP